MDWLGSELVSSDLALDCGSGRADSGLFTEDWSGLRLAWLGGLWNGVLAWLWPRLAVLVRVSSGLVLDGSGFRLISLGPGLFHG